MGKDGETESPACRTEKCDAYRSRDGTMFNSRGQQFSDDSREKGEEEFARDLK